MKKNKRVVVACLGALALGVAAACIIPDKGIVIIVEDCGHEWTASTPGAQGTNGLGGLNYIKTESNQWIAKRYCVNPEKDALLADSNSWFYHEVLDDIIATCESRATALLLGNPNCDQVATIAYVGECPITAEACWPGTDDDADGGAETGGETSGADFGALDLTQEVSVVQGQYVISQLLIDTALADPIGVSNDGTTASQVLDPTGSPYGFEISGVTSTNLGGVLGLQNGDIITEVSNQPTATYDDLLELASILLSANTATVELDRGSTSVTLVYQRGS